MNRKTAIGTLPLTLTISVIDAWFSMQSLAGIIDARNFLDYAAAATGGFLLTSFAVFLPVLKNAFRSFPWGVIWAVITAFDLGSSALGGIWYGTLHHTFREPIMIHQITYDPHNWPKTLIYFGFVAVIAVACVACGYAIAALSSGDDSEGHG